jgi:8-oxo-dGTP pyrophosphatase MutT (NUDIX family)
MSQIHFKTWLENDETHAQALRSTGFWGKQGAGSIVLAKNTCKILLPHRSSRVQEPNTWGVWGGAIDADEDPKIAAKRELQEEAGYHGPITMIPLSVFQKDKFKYHNFLAIVDDEFEPELNWETQGYKWTTLDDLPSPLHFGLQWVLNQDQEKIQNLIDNICNSKNGF